MHASQAPKRPSISDLNVIIAAARDTLRLVPGVSQDDAMACKQMAVAIDLSLSEPDYASSEAMADYLVKNYGWAVCDELIEACESSGYSLILERDRAVVAWVKKHQIKPQMAVGYATQVVVHLKGQKDHEHNVVITEIYADEASYLLEFSDLWDHLSNGKRRVILPFEQLERQDVEVWLRHR